MQIFVRQNNVASAVGVYNQNYFRPGLLDPATGCAEGPSKASTAHVVLSDGSYIETGWYEYKSNATITDYVFYEYRQGANGKPQFFPTLHPDPGGCSCLGQWKILTTLGTQTWNAYVDPDLDGNYEFLGSHDFGISPGGVPKAETSIRGTATSGYDHFANLKRRASDGTWYLWTSQGLDFDNIPNYHWQQDSSSAYQVVHD